MHRSSQELHAERKRRLEDTKVSTSFMFKRIDELLNRERVAQQWRDADKQHKRHKKRVRHLDIKELARVTEAFEGAARVELSRGEHFACLQFPRKCFPLLTMLAEDVDDPKTKPSDLDEDALKVLEEMRSLIASHKGIVLGQSVSCTVTYSIVGHHPIPTASYSNGDYELALDTRGEMYIYEMDKKHTKSKGLPISMSCVCFNVSDVMNKWVEKKLPVPTSDDVYYMRHDDDYVFDGRDVRMVTKHVNGSTSVDVQVTIPTDELVAIYLPMPLQQQQQEAVTPQ